MRWEKMARADGLDDEAGGALRADEEMEDYAQQTSNDCAKHAGEHNDDDDASHGAAFADGVENGAWRGDFQIADHV